MCTFNITVDEELLNATYPGVSKERFGQWLQAWVDDMFPSEDAGGQSTRLSPNALTFDELKENIRRQVEKIDAGTMKFYSSEEVYANIHKKYGF